MFAWTSSIGETPIKLLSLCIILLCGFLMTRLTKPLGLPNVTGYILAGIIIGPSVLSLVPPDIIDGMSFVSDLALSFIAFGVGRYLKKSFIRQTGFDIVVISLFESLCAGVLVILAMRFIFGMAWEFSLLLGAVATVTAPASTMMTIRQHQAHGIFVDTMLGVIAADNVVCLLLFSLITSVVVASASGVIAAVDIILPALYNVAAVVLGLLCGLVLSRIITPARSMDNRLILVVAMLLGISGLCSIVDVSPLLSCMAFGAAYINLTDDREIFRQVDNFTPPIMSIFFIFSGMNLDLGALGNFGLIGVGYFIFRMIGKYFGAYFGSMSVKAETPIRNYLGLALIPQAGVAIGLAFLGQRMLPPDIGDLFLATILASSILYEIVGPVCVNIALFRSGTVQKVGVPAGKAPHHDKNTQDNG